MGLALVKRLVEAHAATIEVETRLGSGTRLALRWPAGAGASTEVVADDPIASSLPVQ